MHNNCKISVITVVLNGSSHIEQTIQSVLNQAYSNLEYIIIDGGSTDGTIDVIKKYQNRITYWESEADKGISDAFNKGIRKATGDVIGIINADDWYEPDALERIAEEYTSNPEIGIFYGMTAFRRGGNVHLHPVKPLAHVGLFWGMSLTHPGVFVRKKTYDSVGMFNLSYRLAMDYDFLLRALLAGIKFKFVDHHLSNYRSGGLSDRFYQESVRECVISQKLQFKKYKLKVNLEAT
ncbi:MAG: glycosyltransferase family 2 protein [Mangrovibacterium sp.]